MATEEARPGTRVPGSSWLIDNGWEEVARYDATGNGASVGVYEWVHGGNATAEYRVLGDSDHIDLTLSPGMEDLALQIAEAIANGRLGRAGTARTTT